MADLEAVEVAERRPVGSPIPPPRGGATRVLAQELADDVRDVMDWFNTATSGHSSFKLKIERKAPRQGPNGENILGHLDTIEERVDDIEEYLADQWGGGKFQLQVMVPNGKGGFQYGRAITVPIAGDPKERGVLLTRRRTEAEPAPAAGDPLADRAIGVSERVADQERIRADRLERELTEARASGGRADMDALRVMMEPLNQQLAQLREQNALLQQQLLQQATKAPPTDPFRDALLSRAVDGENKQLQEQATRYEQRLDKLRDDHSTELRQLRAHHEAETKRLEDRHDRATADALKVHERGIDDLKQAHARELKQLERGQSTEQKTLEVAHQTRVDASKAENDRLKADMVELRSELGKLRERKDKSPNEQLKELAGLKESLEALTGGGDDGDKPWYEKAADALSPIAMRIADRFGGDGEEDDDGAEPAAAAPVAAPQHPPVGRAIRHPQDGQVYIHRGNGLYEGPIPEDQVQAMVQQRRAGRLQAVQRRREAAAGAAAPPVAAAAPGEAPTASAVDQALADAPPPQVAAGGIAKPNPRPTVRALPGQGQAQAAPAPKPRGKPPTPAEVQAAVLFLESAVGRGAKPEEVARSARSLLAGGTLTYIRSVGVDNFLTTVANSKPGTSLATQHGRSFVRQVAKFLFEVPA